MQEIERAQLIVHYGHEVTHIKLRAAVDGAHHVVDWNHFALIYEEH